MSLDFPDYVLLQNLPLEALERVLKGLALLQPNLSQIAPPTLTMNPIRVRPARSQSIAVLSSYPSLLVLGFQNLATENCSSESKSIIFGPRPHMAHPAGAFSFGTALLFVIGSQGWQKPEPILGAHSVRVTGEVGSAAFSFGYCTSQDSRYGTAMNGTLAAFIASLNFTTCSRIASTFLAATASAVFTTAICCNSVSLGGAENASSPEI